MKSKIISRISYLVLAAFILFSYFIVKFYYDKPLHHELKELLTQKYFTDNLIVANKEINNKMVEATPFYFNEKYYYIITEREILYSKTDTPQLSIFDLETNKRVKIVEKNLGLGSAVVFGDFVYVLGTRNWMEFGKSELFLLKLDRNFNVISKRVLVKATSDQKLYNSSIAIESSNKLVVSYEIDQKGLAAYSIKFLKLQLQKNDQFKIENVEKVFKPTTYAACPTIRYIDGLYYLIYLTTNHERHITFQSRISRSKDLINWEESPYVFLSPRIGDYVNSSDVDFVDYHNRTLLFYAIGDQDTYSSIRGIELSMSVKDLLPLYFEKEDKIHVGIHKPYALMFSVLYKGLTEFTESKYENIVRKLSRHIRKYF